VPLIQGHRLFEDVPTTELFRPGLIQFVKATPVPTSEGSTILIKECLL